MATQRIDRERDTDIRSNIMSNSSNLVLLWLVIVCCGSVVAGSTDELSKANTAFAVDLYKKIGEANSGINLFFSPISISTAFAMVSIGVRGDTRDQTNKVLYLDKISTVEAMKQEYKELLTTFKGTTNNYTLNMVNRLFGRIEFPFYQQFIKEARDSFLASLESLDFVGKPEESRLHINQWVEEQTNQKIKDLLPEGSIDNITVMFIVNAIYFKALWEIPFHEPSTEPGPFSISKSEQADMDMMHQLGDEYLNYHNSGELDCEVLELPYLEEKTSMFIFLPHDVEGLPNLEKKLTGENLEETLSSVRRRNVAVQLPKFTIDQTVSLKAFLQMMGMVDLFDEGRADLSGIGSGRLVVSDAVHKAFVKVSEFGTEAAAATGVRMYALSGRPPPIRFIVNRPFMFLIYEKNTKSVLFMGRLVRPPSSEEKSIGQLGQTGPRQRSAASITVTSNGLASLLLLLSAYWLLQ